MKNKGIPPGSCQCSVCGKEKSNTEFTFYTNRLTKDGYRLRCNTNCKSCQKRLSAELRLAKKKAPPKPDWGEFCPICTRPVWKEKDGVKNSWQCDHRHGSSYFRGWICKQCNTGLGGLGDGMVSALRLIKYLLYNELKFFFTSKLLRINGSK